MLGQHPTHRHTGALWRLVRGSIGRGHDTEAITGAPARVGWGGVDRAVLRLVPPVAKRIVLDVHDTFDRVHGGQQLRLFNAFHDDYGFQPIVVFDGEGRFVTALLRPGKRPGGHEIRAFLRRLLAPSAPSGRGSRSCCAPISLRLPASLRLVPREPDRWVLGLRPMWRCGAM